MTQPADTSSSSNTAPSGSANSSAAPRTFHQAIERYEQRLASQQAIVDRCVQRWNRVAVVRGLTFLLSLVPLGLAVAGVAGFHWPWVGLAAIIFLGFLVIAFFHEGMQTESRRATSMAGYYRESLARGRRKWDQIDVPPVDVPPEFLAVSTDLNLLDSTSVYKLLGIVQTPSGIATLRDWIINGASVTEIKRRQQAVAELKPAIEWREKFWLSCQQLSSGGSGPRDFVEWCESDNWFARRGWLLWVTRVTSIVSIVSLIGIFAGFGLALPILGISCGINFLLSIFYAGSIHDSFNKVSTRADEANLYLTLFDRITNYPAKSEKLQSLQTKLKNKQTGAHRNLHSLGRWTALSNIRRSAALFVPYIVLEFLFFWDVHILERMESWKSESGEFSREWFDDLGEWESLSALAKLAADQPQWPFPNVVEKSSHESPDETVVVGTQVGHPLLDENRVPNDVQVGPPGTVLLVTGSNMSGKSTLLRSIGANVVLAQMGSVVCAEELTLSPVHIETSMRIADSLAEGVSFFMAELKRLKQIVDRGKGFQSDTDRTMLFLLDEILQGTNSRERQIAVSRVVRKLIDRHAIGAISTHDLDLATTPELSKACQTVHFSEQFSETNGKKEMTFDYRMKQGIAETTNALKLLEIVGLGEDG